MDSISVEDHETEINSRITPVASLAVDHPSFPIGPDPGPMSGGVISIMSPPNSAPVDKQTPNLSAGNNTAYPNHASPLTSLFLDGDVWKDQTSPLPPPVWDYLRDNREWDTLLTGENFDLDAVNLSLLCATSDYPLPDAMPDLDMSRLQPPPNVVADCAKQHTNQIHKKWHTFAELSSGQMTPAQPENSLIDESYRKRLAERLQPRVQHGILPSTPFLVWLLSLQFSSRINTYSGPVHPSILLQISPSVPYCAHAHFSTRNPEFDSSSFYMFRGKPSSGVTACDISWY